MRIKAIRKAADRFARLWYRMPLVARMTTRGFHRLYYSSRQTWHDTYWLGHPLLKCPLDLWIYQELLFQLRPDVIIECGTHRGGSAFYLASLCDMIGQGRIMTIDIESYDDRPQHDRISYVTGSSTDPDVIKIARDFVRDASTVLIILDSDHSRDHVLEELRQYHQFVTLGSYIIVEDSNVNGHPVKFKHGPGPMEALRMFLNKNDAFEIDRSREKFFMTFNPNGYLKRVK